MIKECPVCGKSFETIRSNKIACSPACAGVRKKQYDQRVCAKARAATRERLGTRICVQCGKEFEPNHPAKVTCSPMCQKKRDREITRSCGYTKKKKIKKDASNSKQIIDINAKAKEMGMTYGQYVAYMEGKKLWNGSQRKTEH